MTTRRKAKLQKAEPSPFLLLRLRREELPVATVALARYLIGKVLVRELSGRRISGRIIETEAYPPGDAAGHAFKGQKAGNRSLFLAPGHAYVHVSYGVHFLLNVSSEPAGVGGGVLLRALEPLEGVELMAQHRRRTRCPDLARGPGRLTQALAIDTGFDGMDLCVEGPLWLAQTGQPVGEIGESVRLGISRETERRRRFYERGNPLVSGPKRLRG
jgi:DNA-3-methyladenine glycosylase|uniref:Putative 3-methyladenine DNA glycosylase n=1 Tax=Desulfobacca acetoxidans TaxID=60893 RepID=A0A7V6A566_9BACT